LVTERPTPPYKLQEAIATPLLGFFNVFAFHELFGPAISAAGAAAGQY
jgi:hypothetical protein